MSYQKIYSREYWENFPSEKTAINRDRLNNIEGGIDAIDDRVCALDTTKVDLTKANELVEEILWDESNGTLTVVKMNGSRAVIDTKLEKLAVNFSFDESTQRLVITLDDSSKQYVDLSAFVTPLEFKDGDIVYFTVVDGNLVSAGIKDGSITEDKLQPNFLADIKVQVGTAEQYRDQAKQYRDETETIRDAVADDKKEIDETIKNSLLSESQKILDAAKGYYDRADELYKSMYIDCDGETPQMRATTLVTIDCGTPQTRVHDDNGIVFDGGTPLSRFLGK